MFFPGSIPLWQQLNPQNEGRMIRATFIALAFGVCALSSGAGAQNPTPAPAPVPPSPDAQKPATQPTPPPRVRRPTVPPMEWSPSDMSDLERRFEAAQGVPMEPDMVPMPGMPPMPVMIDPMIEMDLDFDLTPASDMEWTMDAMSPLDFDFEMAPMPPSP